MSKNTILKLSEIGTLERGKGLQKNNFTSSGIPCIHYGQIFTHYDGFTDSTISFVSPEVASGCTTVHPGDVILALTSENVQDLCKSTVWLGEGNIITGGHSGVFRHEQNPKYLGYFFQSEFFQSQKTKYAKGTKVIEINPKDILDRIEIKLPELETQQKIVQILEIWDLAISRIGKCERTQEKLLRYLCGILLTGEKQIGIKKTNFAHVKLDDIANIERGRILTAENAIEGNIPVIAGGVDSPYTHNAYTHENVITVSASGANAGHVAYRSGKIWASDCNVVYGKDGISNTSFLFGWMVLLQKQIYQLQTGGAQPHVHGKDLAKLEILLPSIDIQNSIVACLSSQIAKIECIKSYKDNLKKQKKYLLNHLISGDFDLSKIKLEKEELAK